MIKTREIAQPNSPVQWWEKGPFLLFMVLASAVPLLWPQLPPLVDLFGHVGRYRVELDLDTSEHLRRYYDFNWAPIGNLGIDLLIIPLAPLLGLEPAVKLIVGLTPPLTVAGIFLVAREVHDRIPPTTLFAVPFVYGYPFHYGFVNFTLSVACALLVFALWLRLGKGKHSLFRAVLFLPLSCLLWVVHVFGWGLLGLLAVSAEIVGLRDKGLTWTAALPRAAIRVLPLAVPFALMVIWRSSGSAGGETGTFFLLNWKLYTLVSALRDRWLFWDAFGVGVALVVIGAGIFDRKLAFSRKLGLPAATLFLAFLMLPFVLFGSAHADMRLAPYILIVALLAVRFREHNQRAESLVAALGLLFAASRLAGNAISLGIADSQIRERLGALDHIRHGAAVLTLASGRCTDDWEPPRHWHLGALVIARRNGFSNDQWQMPGAQLLTVRYAEAVPFHDVKTALVYSPDCVELLNRRRRKGPPALSLQDSLDAFPRKAFDYVWLIKPPSGGFLPPPDLEEIWRSRDSYLYRVNRGALESAQGGRSKSSDRVTSPEGR